MSYGIEKTNLYWLQKLRHAQKHAAWGENDRFLEVKPGGKHIYHWALKGHYAVLPLPRQNSSVCKLQLALNKTGSDL